MAAHALRLGRRPILYMAIAVIVAFAFGSGISELEYATRCKSRDWESDPSPWERTFVGSNLTWLDVCVCVRV